MGATIFTKIAHAQECTQGCRIVPRGNMNEVQLTPTCRADLDARGEVEEPETCARRGCGVLVKDGGDLCPECEQDAAERAYERMYYSGEGPVTGREAHVAAWEQKRRLGWAKTH